uniref:melanopsin-B-like n=1 Tax=Styela clava TaxID=7725 RepID=UPI00193A1082|nr:melanopsin-B-like [Styela clava]
MRFNGNLSIIAHGEIEHGYSGNDYVKTYGNVRNDVDTAWRMRSVDLIIATFMALVGLVSVFGNILLICTFYSCQSLKKKSANVLTIHLAVNNTLVGIVALKIGTLLFLQDTGQKVITSFGEVLSCQVEGAVLSFVHINVMLTIAAMFGDRYVAICFFGKKSSWLSICHHEPYKTILLIWIYSVFWAFWPLTPIVPDYILETSLPCCMFDRQTASFYNIFYLVGMSISVLT